MIALVVLLVVLAVLQLWGMIRSIINHVTGKQQASISRHVTRTVVGSVLVNLSAMTVILWAAVVISRGA